MKKTWTGFEKRPSSGATLCQSRGIAFDPLASGPPESARSNGSGRAKSNGVWERPKNKLRVATEAAGGTGGGQTGGENPNEERQAVG